MLFNKKFTLFNVRVWIFTLLFQTFAMPLAQALTSGPSQPEMSSLSPISSSDMVDLFTGDFSYNIPLLDVEGYPITLGYSSDIAADQEASWVGLGWTLNPGSINRQVRGLPDDFRGDLMERTLNIKNNTTVGVGVSPELEIAGFSPGSIYGSIYYNNYRGFGAKFSLSPTLFNGNLMDVGFSLSGDSQNGSEIGVNSKSLGLGINSFIDPLMAQLNYGASINSRIGLSATSLNSPNASGLLRGRSRINLLSNGFSYVPLGDIPMEATSFRFRATLGTEIAVVHPGTAVDGYVSVQALRSNTIINPAFGTLYAQDGENIDLALTDYNRENYGTYNQEMPNLPAVVGTYDYFSASAAGLNTSFHINRSGVGIFSPVGRNTSNVGASLGGEFGFGGLFHGGFDIEISGDIYQRGKWRNANNIDSHLNFRSSEKDSEGAYLTAFGERGKADNDFLESIHKDALLHTRLFTATGGSGAVNSWLVNNQSAGNLTGNIARDQRQKRTQSISYLTAEEAAKVGLDKQIYNYPENELVCATCPLSSTSGGINRVWTTEEDEKEPRRAAHHISEITITQPDGTRYVYGLPTYNVSQMDETFSIDTMPGFIDVNDPRYGLVNYSTNDASIGNNKGRDNYYDKSETPAHAYGYLLTAILSSDYEDRLEDGISDDDLGTAIKFNYTRTSSGYSWRSVVNNEGDTESYARYAESNRADKNDNKAMLSAGTKEIWYLHSIESRAMIAHFITGGDNDRKDGFGVNTDGTIANDADQRLRTLKEIRQYTKSEIAQATAQSIDPIPLKTAHFEYDYSLGGNTPNSTAPVTKGRLTLKSVYFTFGDSKAGSLHPYQFNYRNDDGNGGAVPYKQGWVNRWGYYQEQGLDYPNHMDFPYAIQDDALAQAQTGLWNLNEITLPSGGKINVTYESDDYAFVQDTRAGRMFFLEGFLSDKEKGDDDPISFSLYDNNGDVLRNYLVINIEELRSQYATELLTLTETQLRELFFEDVEYIYFKALVELTGEAATDNYVTGYAAFEPSSIEVRDENSQLQLLVRINSVLGDKDTHPISQASFQKMRLEMPDLIYPPISEDATGAEVVLSVISAISSVGELLRNFDRKAMRKNWGRRVDCNNKSMVRLADPTYQKLGGGSRVARIEISDEWASSTGIPNTSSVYGQTYDYTTTETINGKSTTISSGVAAWEPLIGGEENLARKPAVYENRNYLAPNNYYYTEYPFVESLFPAPVIGYSKVKVESINNEVHQRTATGWTEQEFYTAKDFPTLVRLSDKNEIPYTMLPLSTPFISAEMEKMTVSQGYVIESNDMHGKMKASRAYNTQGALLESTEYQYQVDNPNAKKLRLNNTVQFANPDNSLELGEMGVEVNVWQEMTQDDAYINAGGAEVQTEMVLIPFIFPIILPVTTVIPSASTSIKQLRTSITTKHIRRYGIVEKVIVTKHGSKLESENLVYDSETGQVLLSTTQNEFEDPVYSWTFPAHWAYEGMSGAYQNIRAELPNISIGFNGRINNLPTGEVYWKAGDEVFIKETSEKYYLYYGEDANGIGWFLMDKSGERADSGSQLNGLILRSGHRNQTMAAMQSIMLLEDPREVLPTPTSLGQMANPLRIDIIQATAVEMSDRWPFNCNTVAAANSDALINDVMFANIFLEGIEGHWRTEKQWTLYDQNDRTVTSINLSPHLENTIDQKRSGEIDNTAYWLFNYGTSKWETTPSPEWIQTEQINAYTRLGAPIESEDALAIASAAQYGYNNTSPVGVTANAELKEIGFETFEDYYFDNASNQLNAARHFYLLSPFYNPSDQLLLTTDAAHSGKYSLKLDTTIRSVTFPVEGEDCDDSDFKGNYGIVFDCNDCLPRFNPYAEREYHFSAWVADDGTLDCIPGLSGAQITIDFFLGNGTTPNGTPITITADRVPVDGWQRLQASFEIPANTGFMKINLEKSTGVSTYFDDIRIVPEDASGKGFVYDPQSMRLMAELDDNNYATFYEYDDAGLLSRIKRETERGVVTIQEGRTVLVQND